jgi:hypothetical protein
MMSDDDIRELACRSATSPCAFDDGCKVDRTPDGKRAFVAATLIVDVDEEKLATLRRRAE